MASQEFEKNTIKQAFVQVYCSKCGLPPDYCEYGPTPEICLELKKYVNMDIGINKQNISAIEYLNDWRQGKITNERYIDKLKEILELTVKLYSILSNEKIFLTTEELTILLSISIAYKCLVNYNEAMKYIQPIERYISNIEENGFVDGIIGIYEMIMEYMGSLYGDMKMFDKSNDISHKLIKISLKLRRSGQIHPNIYNIAWNNNECKKNDFDYNAEINKCIIFSQLNSDMTDVQFYSKKLNG